MRSGNRREACLALLAANPEGIGSASCAKALGIDIKAASKKLQRMASVGDVDTVHEPDGGSACRRLRYFLPEHVEAAMAAHREYMAARRNPPKAARERRPVVRRPAPVVERVPVAPPPLAPPPYVGEVVPPRRPFVVTEVPRFFSAMTPGSYLRTGSAIERAYAEMEGA